MGLRETLNEKPAVGWVVAALLAIVALYLAFFRGGTTTGERPSVDDLKRDVTIRDIETGETWTMNRGRIEQLLYGRAYDGSLDPNLGLPNPNTGKMTGYPELRGGWEDLVERIKTEVAEVEAKRK